MSVPNSSRPLDALAIVVTIGLCLTPAFALAVAAAAGGLLLVNWPR
jgi:hypothetical protein